MAILMTATCLHFSAEMAAACPTCNPSPLHSPEQAMTNDTTPTPEGVTPARSDPLASGHTALVKWLRNPWRKCDDVARGPIPEWTLGLMHEAATMLEALAADLAAQKARADALAERLERETADHDATDRRCKRLVARIQAVEAKAKADGERAADLMIHHMRCAETEKAKVAKLVEAIDYILDGMAIDAPDYEIDPDDDFLDAANSDWVRDVLTRLAAALRGEGGNG